MDLIGLQAAFFWEHDQVRFVTVHLQTEILQHLEDKSSPFKKISFLSYCQKLESLHVIAMLKNRKVQSPQLPFFALDSFIEMQAYRSKICAVVVLSFPSSTAANRYFYICHSGGHEGRMNKTLDGMGSTFSSVLTGQHPEEIAPNLSTFI